MLLRAFAVKEDVWRYFLTGVVFLVGGALGAVIHPSGAPRRPKDNPQQYAAFRNPLPASADAIHAVDRLTFGARPDDLEHFRALGRRRWIEEQLHPERIPENPQLEVRLQPLTLLWISPGDLQRQMNESGTRPRVIAEDLNEAKLLRAIYCNRQLAEILDDFWYNHFNVFLNKGADRYYVPSYERDVIRPHILGKFYDLLLATAQSPAMLFYLDNWQSVGSDSQVARSGRKRGLNENYGRELLELHTLGVDGGYTQQDVIDVARCFTGWTISAPREGGSFTYKDKWHDKGQKIVIGHTIKAGGGMDDGLQVLAILARQPATAHFISWKLAQRFVADDPPPSLVNRMAATFLRKDGDLREVMRTMLLSPEFWSEGAYRAKVKMPFEIVVSALRVTDAEVVSARDLTGELTKLGEPLYRRIEPSGYSSANAEWVSSASLLTRMNLALALSHNRIHGVHLDLVRWSAGERDRIRLATALLGQTPDPETAAALAPANDIPTMLGLALGSPDFQRH